ncbi:hypothetical protein H8S95_01755 [Pontibacter sp. KCTC 32443]|uniref:hypothetical protein n=1 Tax=Pontibacter TaxID=323449 RepID=UPI00164CEF2F|nr:MULTISPECIES: hypothetical protein [Pontibacter]MBC5772774.1 hypothetical protein [Pontibacter sp. KCTC 32443]
MKKTSYFWVGFSDLMTSLFFIILILFSITLLGRQQDQVIIKSCEDSTTIIKDLRAKIDSLNQANNQLTIERKKFDEIQNVEKALSTLDPDYYTFDHQNKRYKLKLDVVFKPNESDISNLSLHELDQLMQAGEELYNKVNTLVQANKEIEYLLIIEGNTERYKNNWVTDPNRGYELSYERALALFNFWKDNGIDFNKLKGQCEVIIAGSGYFGQSRNTRDEGYNRRFSIQVTSKVGKFLQKR